MNRHAAIASTRTQTQTRALMLAAAASAALVASPAAAQSLFNRNPTPVVDADGRAIPQAELRSASFFFVAPPEPREYRRHDIVYVIVDEITTATSSQSLETEKTADVDLSLNSILSPEALLEAQLRAGTLQNLSLIQGQGQNTFEGEGDYDRTDRITARLAAKVIDVKPNGTLVIEARKQLVTDDEVRTMVLSGIATENDITNANSILSSQLADLKLELQHEGELRKAAKKGFLTKMVEAIFGI